nr:RNA polymerase sigma-70 factor [uncultured Draconibacterium sp.]
MLPFNGFNEMGKEENADSDLWRLIRADNENAFSSVFDKYFHLLSRFSYSFLNDVEAAEDVVSDVFVKLWLNRNSIVLKSSLKSYLYSAVKNTALNYLRDYNKSLSLEDVAEKDLVTNISADSNLVQNEILSEFHEFLSTLSPQQSTILRMHKLEGLSQKEISDKLSISLKTVQNHTSLAMRFVSEKMASHQSDFYIFLLFLLTVIY